MEKKLFDKIIERTAITITKNELKGLTKIGHYAFAGGLITNVLSGIEIPDTVTSIGSSSFSSCELLNINVPDNVTSIGVSAFSNCKKLIDINLSTNINEIPKSCFYNCTVLPSITIPSKVSIIGDLAFENTNAISNVTFLQTSGAMVTLPTAGSSTGMFYSKTARAVNIYTDNETIKNYDWATDGVTATFYHLDGTLWE